MSTTQDTITVTLMRPVTFTLPRTLTETTEPQLVDDALDAFFERAQDAPGALYYSKAVLTTIATAMREGTAVCIRYEHDGEVSARVLYPSAIIFTNEQHLTVRAFCTYRRQTKCFRLDRMACMHPVVLPGDVTAA